MCTCERETERFRKGRRRNHAIARHDRWMDEGNAVVTRARARIVPYSKWAFVFSLSLSLSIFFSRDAYHPVRAHFRSRERISRDRSGGAPCDRSQEILLLIETRGRRVWRVSARQEVDLFDLQVLPSEV